MDIYDLAVSVDEKINAVGGVLGEALWATFIFIQTCVFEPLLSIGGDIWVYASTIAIAFYISLFKWARILRGERSWQLALMRTIIAKGLIVAIPIVLLSWFLGAYYFSGIRLHGGFYQDLTFYLESNFNQFKKGLAWGVVAGFLIVLFIGRILEPFVDRWLNRQTIKSNKNSKLSDVRSVQKDLPTPFDFDPYAFFELARNLTSLFFGKDSDNRSIFIPRSEWNHSNILLLGPTRRGKGVQACMVLAQCLFFDEPDIVVCIDPKGDDWGPLVLRDACRRANLPFVYIDARRGKPFQFNVFQGATKDELIALIAAGYDLHPKGSSDDHYRTLEQDAVESIVEYVEDNPTIRDLYDAALHLFSDSELENIQGLLSKLKQDVKLGAVNSKAGPKISDLFSRGGVFWFVGSEDDLSVVRMQRIFAQRAVQILRNRTDKSRHATIFADELKHVLSGPFYKNFGTILGAANANILAAIQSKGDLEDIPQNLNPRAVAKTIFDNTNLKWCYRTNDPETVDWIVQMEGTKVISKERHTVERNAQLAETTSSERSVMQEEAPYLHQNHVKHLPNNCAVLLGYGVAKIAYTSPIKVPFEVIQPTHIQGEPEKFKRSLGDELL